MNNPKLKDIQQMSDAELLGMWGAKLSGWSIAQLELSRRGIHLKPHESVIILDYQSSNNITKSLHTLKSEVVQFWRRLCKSLFLKAEKCAHPQINKKR